MTKQSHKLSKDVLARREYTTSVEKGGDLFVTNL